MYLPKYFHWNNLYAIINLLGPDEFSWEDWYYISKNPNVTWRMVISHPEWPWNYAALSTHPDLDLNYVLEHMDWNWDFDEIIMTHKQMTVVMAHRLSGENACFSSILYNKNITWDLAKLLGFNNSDLTKYLCNPNTTMELYESELCDICKNDNDKDVCCFCNYDCDCNEFSLVNIINIGIILANQNTSFADLIKYSNTVFNWFVEFIYTHREHIKCANDIVYTIEGVLKLLLNNPDITDVKDFIFYDNKIKIRKAGLRTVINKLVGFISKISENPNIEFAKIRNELYKWDINTLMRNNALTMVEKIELYKNKPNVDIQGLLKNPYFDREIAKQYNITVDPELFKETDPELKYILSQDINFRDMTFRDMNLCNMYITYKDVLDNKWEINPKHLKNIAKNKFNKHGRYTQYYLAKKYFYLWHDFVYNKIEAQIEAWRTIYDCCLHELQMRWRDAANKK